MAAALLLLAAAAAACSAASLDRNENGVSRGPVWSKNRYGRFVQSMYGSEKPGPHGGIRSRVGALCAELENDIPAGTGWTRYGRALFPGHRHGNAFMYGRGGNVTSARWDFGLIKAAAAEKAVLSIEERNWTNAKLVSRYETDSGQERTVSVIASRLTPAMLVETDGDDIILFGGKKYNWQPTGGGMDFSGLGHPVSYAAVGSAAGVEIKAGSKASELPLDPLEKGWLLLWYSANPVGTSQSLARHSTPYWASVGVRPELDCPFLVAFNDAPWEMGIDETGGLYAAFLPGEGGSLVFMPLFGDDWPLAKATASWAQGLPEEITTLCGKWAARMRQFPLEVEEDYLYDDATDTVELRCAFGFQPVGEGGEMFAPVPPMLALAADYGFPAAVSPALSGPAMTTAIGPYRGVDGHAEYTVKITGMGKYWKETRAPATAEPETGKMLTAELERQADKLLETGVLTPVENWRYCKYEWDTAGDYIFYFLEAWPYLSEGTRAKATAFLDEIIEQWPPDTPARIEQWQGSPRGAQITERGYTGGGASPEQMAARKQKWEEYVKKLARATPPTFPAAYGMTPWRNLYAMARYKEAGGKAQFPDAEKSVLELLELGIAHQDWASLGWFQWEKALADQGSYLPYKFRWYGTGGTADANNWFNACLGAVRLAKTYGQERDFEAAAGLFARAAALRLAQTRLRTYLNDKKLWTETPEEPLIKPGGLEPSSGRIHRNEWRDIRETISFDEFGASFWDTDSEGGGGSPCSIFPLRDATPELLRFLRDYLKPEYTEFAGHYAAFDPAWYIAKKDPMLGSEATIEQPETGQQVFLMFARVTDATPDFLRRRIDQPWYPAGDFHYWQRLVETLYSIRGEFWRGADEETRR